VPFQEVQEGAWNVDYDRPLKRLEKTRTIEEARK
jgi:hypothetical protein